MIAHDCTVHDNNDTNLDILNGYSTLYISAGFFYYILSYNDTTYLLYFINAPEVGLEEVEQAVHHPGQHAAKQSVPRQQDCCSQC